MKHSNFYLNKLRVIKDDKVVYDEIFHKGVNIIQGENGSGKSTIADFIFYAIGGHIDSWKTEAGTCDEVQAEITTNSTVLTFRRLIHKANAPIQVFFGNLEKSQESAPDGWQAYPLKRSESKDSFSQIVFRASGIPEAQSDGASNITMHQLLRLLYADQRTPAPFLFRYESFDTSDIRNAVGDLVCGLSSYDLYEIELQLRDFIKVQQEKKRDLKSLKDSLLNDHALMTLASIDSRTQEILKEHNKLLKIDTNKVSMLPDNADTEFTKERTQAAKEISKCRASVESAEDVVSTNSMERTELSKFIEYLSELAEKLSKAENISNVIGAINFTHCPACLSSVNSAISEEQCDLCGSNIDPELEKSRSFQIKIDIDLQLKESKQLQAEKEKIFLKAESNLRLLKKRYRELVTNYTIIYENSPGPRDSVIAERYRKIGLLEAELSMLEQLREQISRIEDLETKQKTLKKEIDLLESRKKALLGTSEIRRKEALTLVSDIGKKILRRDLPRQIEFQNSQNMRINFGDNSILVDDELNFAESSNVIAKNTAILALLLAPTEDKMFYHPRFILMDNIEDKGMEPERSHNFQKLIIELSEQTETPHQIIFTTSTPSPEIDMSLYSVGIFYTNTVRTLLL